MVKDDDEDAYDYFPGPSYSFLVAGTIQGFGLSEHAPAPPLQCWFDQYSDNGVNLQVVEAAVHFMETNGAHADDIARLRASAPSYVNDYDVA